MRNFRVRQWATSDLQRVNGAACLSVLRGARVLYAEALDEPGESGVFLCLRHRDGQLACVMISADPACRDDEGQEVLMDFTYMEKREKCRNGSSVEMSRPRLKEGDLRGIFVIFGQVFAKVMFRAPHFFPENASFTVNHADFNDFVKKSGTTAPGRKRRFRPHFCIYCTEIDHLKASEEPRY